MWAYTDDEAGWLDLEHARRDGDKRDAKSARTETAADMRAQAPLPQAATDRGTHLPISG
jgi:hypothetical protein